MHEPSLPFFVVGFFLLLFPLIVLHELGHYLAGRLFGVKADAFSVGFGREVLGRTDKRGTRWKLSLLPLGGYVQFAGDSNAASAPDPNAIWKSKDERDQMLQYKPVWQRAIVIAAGPITNLLVAVVVFAVFNMAYGVLTASPVVSAFTANSVAQSAGMQVGDRITAINGSRISDFEEIQEHVRLHPGAPITIEAARGGKPLRFNFTIAEKRITDKFGNSANIGMLGIAGKQAVQRLGPVEAVADSIDQCGAIIKMMATGLGQIIGGQRSAKELGGPISMVKLSGEQLSLGWAQFVYFVAFTSINLAFINLLPIPALDGGHLVLLAVEAVRRKPVSPRGQEWAMRTGFALVIALMLFVTVNDLVSLHIFGG